MISLKEKLEAQEARPDIKELKEFVIQFGGDRFQVDWHLNREFMFDDEDGIVFSQALDLIAFGRLFDGKIAKLRPMANSRCHENSFYFSKLFSSYEPWTGLALSADGIWRTHSWCKAKRGSTLIETTEVRELYYGIRVFDFYDEMSWI